MPGRFRGVPLPDITDLNLNMDPVSAIGLVASVGSFITFARKVVSVGDEISHAENGLLYDDFTTETVAGSLEQQGMDESPR